MLSSQLDAIPGTLGTVLYARPPQGVAPEHDWRMLVRRVAAGERAALHALYERTHRVVFTLIMRLTCNPEVAEELTLDVYHEVWRDAAGYDAAHGTVVGWIMNRARARAVARLRSQQRQRSEPGNAEGLVSIDTPDYRDLLRVRDQSRMLSEAVAALTADERRALEDAYFTELPCVDRETAARVRSALHRLRKVLAESTKRVSPAEEANDCGWAGLACAHAVHAVAAQEVAAVEDHLASCRQCRRELELLRPLIDSFVVWPTDVLRPAAALQRLLGQSMAAEAGDMRRSRQAPRWRMPRWEEVAPGISCKLLATDAERHMVSMLVRLAPGGEYPPHTHAAVEELHLLDGELWIDDRKLHAGDYNRAEPGSGDKRVWSETGCTCVLVTSSRDILR